MKKYTVSKLAIYDNLKELWSTKIIDGQGNHIDTAYGKSSVHSQRNAQQLAEAMERSNSVNNLQTTSP